jgi:putative cardiolipin synthase
LLQKNLKLKSGEAEAVYRDLHEYARNEANFAPEVRSAIDATPESFDRLANQLVWTDVAFVSDRPGKNDNQFGLGGGGDTTSALARLVEEAGSEILIQSPYLVLSDEAIALFKRAIARGVSVSVSTNSLASTDNLPAFSGYRKQRARLIRMGMNIAEFRPDPAIRKQLIQRALAPGSKAPTFALHAKTMVIDSAVAVIGTFNLDPRSENLNTEVGAIVRDPHVAARIAESIHADMAPGSSWNAARDDPDRFASQEKRAKVRMYQVAPIVPLL